MAPSELKMYLLVAIFVVFGAHTTDAWEELGMENDKIKDAQITATSCYNIYSCTNRARLNEPRSGSYTGGWRPKENNQDQYIQVDLLSLHVIKGIMTQGQTYTGNYWVTSFKVLYSLDGLIWTTIKNEEHESDRDDTIFSGNSDRDTVVSHEFYDIIARFVRIVPVSWADAIGLRFELIGTTKATTEDTPRALGMKGNLIPDSAITASTEYSKSKARRARLDMVKSKDGQKGGWSPKINDVNQWLQVDLNGIYLITGVITQGRQDGNRWVTAFKVDYSNDGTNWKTIGSCNGKDKVFPANSDRNTKVTTEFPIPVEGRFIRIRPYSWYGFIAMRIEILGRGPVAGQRYEPLELGMEDGRIEKDQLTASSCYDQQYRCVDRARLNQGASGKFKGAWSAKNNDPLQWIQVDFQHDIKLEGIVTQGKSDLNQWVTTYSLQYGSNDRPSLKDYEDSNGNPMVFHANSDRNTPVTNLLPLPVTARFVRILPKTWMNFISMRFDLLGAGPTGDNVTPTALGIEDRRVASTSMTTTSCADPKMCVSASRLNMRRNNRTLGSWTADVDDQNQWIQVDLRSAFEVTGVITQGRDASTSWVTSYSISFSTDGMNWAMITDCHPGPKIFRANYDARTTVENTLNPPVTARFFRLHPVTWNSRISLRWELMGKGPVLVTDTPEKLGLEDYRIPTGALTASSQYSATYAPDKARLNLNYGWLARLRDTSQWLQINLMGTYQVTGIITQGRTNADNWVTAYRVAYGSSTQNLTTILVAGSDQEQVFPGNKDRSTEVTNYFAPPVTASIIRILPNTWNGYIGMRVELLGLGPVADLGVSSLLRKPLGIESGLIPDSSFSASSQYNVYAAPATARLNQRKVGSYYGSWIARTLNVDQWIQVDLLRPYRIVGVATQGRPAVNQYVKTFKLACSMDGATFDTVKACNTGADKVFTGNVDYDTVVYNGLPEPKVCRYVRLMPMSWNSYISLRMELYGEGPVAVTA